MALVQVVERCKISPPPKSVPQTSLPLTFFDIPWLFFSPSQPLFFYEYPHSTSCFLSTTLPNLKKSLSLTLQHFFPFAGNLSLSSEYNSGKPEIVYDEDDYVFFTVAESNGDFCNLSGYHPRDANEFYPLVPLLTSGDQVPLLAVQITVFSKFGVCIGLAYHNVVADGRTFNNFIKTWASFCRNSSFFIKSSPSYDRTVIFDAYGLEEILLNEWYCRRKCTPKMVTSTGSINVVDDPMVRATFVMGLKDMEKIRRWIIDQCNRKNQPQPVHLSAYVVTCAFIWVCLMKTHTPEEKYFIEDPNYFGFVAGGLNRLEYPVPTEYFGTCVGFGRCEATRNELMGEEGIIVAANVIGNKIKELDKAMFKGAEKWISDWDVFFGSELHVMVSGSPKVDLYDTDFGWGRAKKIEEISIDCTRAISLTQSRDLEGGIDVGLALPNYKMEAFTFLFTQGLKSLQ